MKFNTQKIIIANRIEFDNKLSLFIKDGKKNICLVSDFDKTITKLSSKAPSVISLLRKDLSLSNPQYKTVSRELYLKYYKYENDTNYSRKFREKKMEQWWGEHFTQLAKHKITKKMLEHLLQKCHLDFRAKTWELFQICKSQNWPFFIISAGPGDLIEGFLEKEKMFYKNLKILANFWKFDSQGNFVSPLFPIIHSLNKSRISRESLPEKLRKHNSRKNLLLLGDGLGDSEMDQNFKPQNTIKICFLEKFSKDVVEKFSPFYDVLLLQDQGFGFVIDLLSKIQ